MADLDTNASPLSHSKHQRYRRLARVRHSKQFEEFLTVQATRLSTTTAAIFALLDSYTADMIAAAASVGALPAVNSEHGH
jgi:hypothetical protein